MSDAWGKLTDEEREALRSRARTFTQEEIDERFAVRDDVVFFRLYGELKEEEVGEPSWGEAERYEVSEQALISPEDFDYDPEITASDREAAQPIDEELAGLEDYCAHDRVDWGEADTTESEAKEAGLPPEVDHRARQSPIKEQGLKRGTCVAHASLALVESFPQIPDDLSEQYTHYKFNEFYKRPHDKNSGLKTTDAPRVLAHPNGRICLEEHWPYEPSQAKINRMVRNGTYRPPQAALDNQTYGYLQYKIIGDSGLTGESIRNTRFLEALLSRGYDIVIGAWVAWDDKENDGILDPLLDSQGNPIKKGGHAMLVVGYNRPSQYFILKNSWDFRWKSGHDGYGWFHYDYVRTYFKYGFVVRGVVP